MTEAVLAAGIAALHAKVGGAGQVITGGVVSTLREMICVHVALLPHSSVARYVRVLLSIQDASVLGLPSPT